MVPEVSSSTTTVPPLEPHLHRRRRLEIRIRRGEPRQRRHRGHLSAQIGVFDAGQPGRHLLPIGQTLIAAKPANLGDESLHVGDPLRGNRIQDDAGRLGPLGDHQRLFDRSAPATAPR